MQKEIKATPIRSDFLPAIPDIRRIPEFVEFAKWCATPSWSREMKTQKEFAERIGVSQDTLCDWKKHTNFRPLFWRFLRDRMQEQIPDAIEGFSEKIVSGKGSASDLKLFLRIAGGEPTQPKINNQDYAKEN